MHVRLLNMTLTELMAAGLLFDWFIVASESVSTAGISRQSVR